jgi:hypothetical protein
MFCAFSSHSYQLTVNEPIDGVPVDVKNKAVRDAAETLIWLAKRQCEISLFRYLQDVVNSSEPVCAENMRANALGFLYVLATVPKTTRRDVKRRTNAKACVPSIDITLIDQLQDRQNRIRAALFVYTSISISKLPAWSEFWSQMESSYYSFPRETLMASLTTLDALDGLLKSHENKMATSNARLLGFHEAFQALDPRHDPNKSIDSDAHSDSDSDSLEDFCRFMRELRDGKIDEMIEMADKEITGGLLLAKTPEEVARRRSDAFFELATFNWEKGLPRSNEKPASDEDHLHSRFLAQIRTRLKAFFIHITMKEGIKRLTTLGYSETRARSVTKQETLEIISPSGAGNHMKSCEKSSEFEDKMREGARWAELVDLIGVDEILLYSKLPDLFISGSALQTLDISTVVNGGTDQEFRHLKKILQSPTHLWVKETCLELHGVLKMIVEADTMRISNWAESLTLAQQIEARVTKVFGSRSFVLDLSGKSIDPLEGFMYAFLYSIVKHTDRGCPHLRAVSVEAMVEAFRATRRERKNVGNQDNTRAGIKCLRKNLRKTVEGLSEVFSKQGAATQQKFDQIRRSLLEAIESFILAISVTTQDHLPDVVGGSDAKEADFNKYIERSAEAFRAAFSTCDEDICGFKTG